MTIEEKRYGILAIKTVYSSTGTRYLITNPSQQYAVSEKFFKQLKRSKSGDKFPKKCLIYLFKVGLNKWQKRYQGYKNILGS